jgi:thioredoxin-like negative regulator of GroEL
MRGSILRGALVGALALTALPARAAKMPWAGSFNAAIIQARKSNKLVMIDFYTDWCGPCKLLERNTYTQANVISATTTHFVPVKLNAEQEGRALAQQYEVHSYPTILMITPDGRIQGRFSGYRTAGPFVAQIREVAESRRSGPVLEARLKRNPSDADAASKLAIICVNRGEHSRAAKLLAKVKTPGPAMVRSFLAVGGAYQDAEENEKAVPLYRKVLTLARNPQDVAAAHLKLATCYYPMGDIAGVRRELQAVRAMKDAPDEMKRAAVRMLAAIPK